MPSAITSAKKLLQSSALLLVWSTSLLAETSSNLADVIIENVYIATSEDAPGPVRVVVKDNKLDLITRDPVSGTEGVPVLDANGGYLIGDLELGAAANFIILDSDPRDDIAPLLDTRGSTVFAFYRGEVQTNELATVDAAAVDARRRVPQWHAYMAPPVALPTRYRDAVPWNHWSTPHTNNVFFAVLAIDRNYWISQDTNSEQQVGSLDDFVGGEIRDLRLGLYGNLNFFDQNWGYNIAISTNAFDQDYDFRSDDRFRFLDYRIDIPFENGLRLSLGKQKEPVSMERLMSLLYLPMQERSTVAEAFIPSRNFGALLSGTALGGQMSWAAGVFNNFIDNDTSLADGITTFTSRFTWLPYASPDDRNLIHLAVSGRFSSDGEDVRLVTKPEFNKAPNFADSGLLDADEINQLAFEASWRKDSLWISSEVMATEVDTLPAGRRRFNGYRVTASWVPTGQMRPYDRSSGLFGAVPVSRPVDTNGAGSWELAARWSSLDLNDGPIDGGKLDILSFGVNWWLTSVSTLNLNYRYIVNDRNNLEGEASGANIRILLHLK